MCVSILGGDGHIGAQAVPTLPNAVRVWATVFRRPEPSAATISSIPPGRWQASMRCGCPALRGRSPEAKPDAVVNCIGIVNPLCDADSPVPCLTVNGALSASTGRDLPARAGPADSYRHRGRFLRPEGDVPGNRCLRCRGLYGRSKFLGEVDGRGCLTLRTSIIGRELSGSSGLIEWFESNRDGKSARFSQRDLQRLHHPSPGRHYRRRDRKTRGPRRALPRLLRSDQQVRFFEPGERDLPAWNRDRTWTTSSSVTAASDSSRFRSETGFRPFGLREIIQTCTRIRALTTHGEQSAIAWAMPPSVKAAPCPAVKLREFRRLARPPSETTRKGVSSDVHGQGAPDHRRHRLVRQRRPAAVSRHGDRAKSASSAATRRNRTTCATSTKATS